jgi:hypothetical protein
MSLICVSYLSVLGSVLVQPVHHVRRTLGRRPDLCRALKHARGRDLPCYVERHMLARPATRMDH